jgi:hypothetical protein
MKRSTKLLALMTGTSSLFAASPAFAQYSDDAAGAALGFGLLACYGIVLLVLLAIFVWWIFMVIDAFKRQEYEFPNSTGNSKTIWLVVLLVGWAVGFLWAVTPVYYFMVYKKAPKPGTVAPPAATAPAPTYQPPAPAAPQAPPAAPPAPPAPPAPAAPPAPPAPPQDME